MRNFASHALFSCVFLLSSQMVALCQPAPQRSNPATAGGRQAMSDGQAIDVDWARLPNLPQRQNGSTNVRWDTLTPNVTGYGGSRSAPTSAHARQIGASHQPQASLEPHSNPVVSSTAIEKPVSYSDVNTSRRTVNVAEPSGNPWSSGRPSAGIVLPTSAIAEVSSTAVPELALAPPPQAPTPTSTSTTLSFTDTDAAGPGLITSHEPPPTAPPVSKPLHVEGTSLLVGMKGLPSEPPSGSADAQASLQLESLIPKEAPASDREVSATDSGPLQLLSLIQRDGALNEQGVYELSSMFAPLGNASDLVRRSDAINTLIEAPILLGNDVRGYAGSPDQSNPWPTEIKTWITPTFEHQPLYFEQVNLERYGYGPRPFFQPLASSAHFYGSILILPYKLCTQHPCEKVYPLGHQRPGDPACYQLRTFLGEAYPGDAFQYFADDCPSN